MLITELNPQRPAHNDSKPLVQRYTDYFHGSVKDELSKKIGLTNDSIQKMGSYIDMIAPKLNTYMLRIVKDWYSAKLQCAGMEIRIAKEIDIAKKGLQAMITALNKELDIANKEKIEQMIEVESTRVKFKDLLLKEQELKTLQMKMIDMTQLMEERVRKIIELDDTCKDLNEMMIEKDEKIIELNQDVEDGVVELDEVRGSLNAVINQCKVDNSNLMITITNLTNEKNNIQIEFNAFLKEEQRYQDSLVCSSSQVDLKYQDCSIQTEFITPPMELRTILADKHSMINARGKRRSAIVVSQSLDLSGQQQQQQQHQQDHHSDGQQSLDDFLVEGNSVISNITNNSLHSSLNNNNHLLTPYQEPHHAIHYQKSFPSLTTTTTATSLFKQATSVSQNNSVVNVLNNRGIFTEGRSYSNNNNSNSSNQVIHNNPHHRSLSISSSVDSVSSKTINDVTSLHSHNSNNNSINNNISNSMKYNAKLAISSLSFDNLSLTSSIDATTQVPGASSSTEASTTHLPSHPGSFLYIHDPNSVPQKYIDPTPVLRVGLPEVKPLNILNPSSTTVGTGSNGGVTGGGVGATAAAPSSSSMTVQSPVSKIKSKVTTTSSSSVNETFNLDSPRVTAAQAQALAQAHMQALAQQIGDNTKYITTAASSSSSQQQQQQHRSLINRSEVQVGHQIVNGIVYNNKGFSSANVNTPNTRSLSPSHSVGSITTATGSVYLGSGLHVDNSIIKDKFPKTNYRNMDNYMIKGSNSETLLNDKLARSKQQQNQQSNSSSSSNAMSVSGMNIIDQKGIKSVKDRDKEGGATATPVVPTGVSDDILKRLRKELASR